MRRIGEAFDSKDKFNIGGITFLPLSCCIKAKFVSELCFPATPLWSWKMGFAADPFPNDFAICRRKWSRIQFCEQVGHRRGPLNRSCWLVVHSYSFCTMFWAHVEDFRGGSWSVHTIFPDEALQNCCPKPVWGCIQMFDVFDVFFPRNHRFQNFIFLPMRGVQFLVP